MKGAGTWGGMPGFSLMELMIVVAIIGLLSAIALPVFNSVRQASQNSAAVNDLRTFSEAFSSYILETGTYPPDASAGQVPEGMAGRIAVTRWTRTTPIGGNYDWDYMVSGAVAAVGITAPVADVDQLRRLDQRADDGNLSTGNIQFTGGALRMIIE